MLNVLPAFGTIANIERLKIKTKEKNRLEGKFLRLDQDIHYLLTLCEKDIVAL
jgi:hypothetical protein